MIWRYAGRSLRRTPLFTAAALLSLVLGIATVGAMFAVVYGVLLAPLAYGDPERLVSIELHTTTQERIGQPPALLATWARGARQLEGLAYYRGGSANLEHEGAEHIGTSWISASMLPVLRVAPLFGRNFNAEEMRSDGDGAVLLSESLWRTRFAADRNVLGRSLVINGVPRQIIGVMPAGFAFPDAATRLWLPARDPRDASAVADFHYAAVARLADGATADAAQRELATLLPRLADAFPRLDSGAATATWLAEARPSPRVRGLRETITADIADSLWLLAAAAVLVLLVAWANVAGLMWMRADSRQREFALRSALGAGRWRVASPYLAESALLALAATACSAPLVAIALALLRRFGPGDVPRLAEVGFGPATLVCILLVAALGMLVGTIVAAARGERGALAAQLRDGDHGASSGPARLHFRALLTVVQIAIALAVSLGSALLLHSAWRLHAVQPGFSATNVTTFRTLLPFARYDDAATVAFYARLRERVAALPMVQSAGLTQRVPLAGRTLPLLSLRAEGESQAQALPMNVVDDGYFTTLAITRHAGRGFHGDAARQRDEVILSRLAALRAFGADDASVLGRRLTLAPDGPGYTVVGIVGDVRDEDLAQSPAPLLYRPLVAPVDALHEPRLPHSLALVVRADAAADGVLPAVRRIVRELDPAVPVFEVETLTAVVRASTSRLSLALALLAAAATISLLLGAIGLYGVMAYLVALRRREFGVRVALGASPRQIAQLVAARGLALTATGITLGYGLYALATPALRGYLYGVSVLDPLTLAAATTLLLATATAATWLPARRAAAIDPATALRAE